MTLQTSGPISLGDVRTELGGSGAQSLKTGSEDLGESVAPYSLSELYGKSSALLELSDYSYTFPKSSYLAYHGVTVTSSTGWSTTLISTGDGTSWVGVSPTSGSNGATCTLFPKSDNNLGYRSAIVRFSIPGLSVDYTVNQLGNF